MPTDVIVLLIQVLIKYGPDVFLKVKSLLSKTNVTLEDFAELDNLLAKSGESYFEKK